MAVENLMHDQEKETDMETTHQEVELEFTPGEEVIEGYDPTQDRAANYDQTKDPTLDPSTPSLKNTPEGKPGDVPAPEPEPEKEEPNVLDILQPVGAREQVIGHGEYERRYIQKPLSWMAKMRWIALVGGVLDKSMSGENALTVSNLMQAPSARGGTLTADDFRDADTFVQAVAKLVMYSPDFLTQSYCIWLNVPEYERELVGELMEMAEQDGGLSDTDGIALMTTFVAQNGEALRTLFQEVLPKFQRQVQATLSQGKRSPQSRP
jgi:hypothetical protein